METLQRTANRGSVSTGYDIDNSCKFEADNSESLERDPSSAGDRQKFTTSMWVKRTELGQASSIFSVYPSSGASDTTVLQFGFMSDDRFQLGLQTYYSLQSTRVFRDTSAWYHIVLAVDTTQSTSTNRFKVYVNGVLERSWDTEAQPAQNHTTGVNNTEPHRIGTLLSNSWYFSGYLAEINHVDGSQLAPTDFGEFDDDTGIWIPKKYSGSYGTNGYFLDFKDGSNMGNDASGGTDFTETNITAADQATDSPTNNFCILNPAYQAQATKYHTVSNGGTFVTGNQSGTAWDGVAGTIPLFKGKWYFELKKDGGSGTNMLVGAGGIDEHLYNWRTLTTITTGAKLYFSYNGTIYANGQGGGASWTDNDIISIAIDQDNLGIYYAKNGTWINSGDPESGASLTGANTITWGTSIPAFNVANNVGGLELNFGGFDGFTVSSGNADANGYGNFEYAPPSGYYAICTKNLAEYG